MSRKEREEAMLFGLARLSHENKPAHDRLMRLLARLMAEQHTKVKVH